MAKLWLRIRDFTKDGGVVRAGSGGYVAGAPVKCFIGHQCEGEGFLRVFGHAEFGGAKNLNSGKCRCQLGDEQGIVTAATGDD